MGTTTTTEQPGRREHVNEDVDLFVAARIDEAERHLRAEAEENLRAERERTRVQARSPAPGPASSGRPTPYWAD